MIGNLLSLLMLLAPGAPGPQAPLLYLPFDGSTGAVTAAGDPRELAGAPLTYVPGLRGEAGVVRADVRFASARNFRPAEGTFACWLRPEWPGTAPESRVLFCLYGGSDDLPRWQSNRWTLAAAGGGLGITLYTSAGKSVGVTAPIAAWKAGEWHHVAATWKNLGSGRADAELRLYVDGAESGTAVTGADLPMGPVGETLDIGRDSDGSPDYTDAALDEVYLYGRALSAGEIAAAVDALRTGKEVGAAPAARPARHAPGWDDPERPFRVRVTLPAARQNRDRVFAALPLDLSADLSRLGLAATVDPASLLLATVRETGDGRRGGKPAAGASTVPPIRTHPASHIPHRVRDGRLEWTDGATPAAKERQYLLYFRALCYDFTIPLLARRPAATDPAGGAELKVPDYATDAYGDAWDFDEGDTDGIDQWGNKPEYIRGRQVEGGVLKLDVSEDPWFIWGDMWGQVQRSQRPVKIDVARYPVLEMRVRQSAGQAEWTIFGRPPGSTSLLTHDFIVSGTGWQTVRVDLRRDARWGGTITAFRIDPTNDVNAHVEIDWVRLTPVQEARRAPVEVLGHPSGVAARVDVVLQQPRPRVDSEQLAVVRVRDAAGRPVAGQPVRLALAAGSGGALDSDAAHPSLGLGGGSRRAVTGPDGQAGFRYHVSRRAGPHADRLEALAEFTALQPARVEVAAQAGPPHHYVVEPAKPRILGPGGPPLTITARLTDACDNPVPGGGRSLSWSAPGAVLAAAGARTAPDGSARATFRGDPARQWVTRISLKDAAGLAGESAPISVLPAGPRTGPVRLQPNGTFTAGGEPWMPLGGFYANWVQLPTPDGEWSKLISFTDATEEQIVAWLRFLKENGVTALRFMLRTHRKDGMEPMDICGRVNPGLFASILRYLDLARPFGIRFLLVLHEDYTKPLYYNSGPLEKYALPWFAGIDLNALPPFQRRFVRDRDFIESIDRKYTDPDVLACQDRYAREIIGLVKDNPQVFAYELENEMVECPASWANHAISTIRSVDPATPICVSHGGGGLHTGDPQWWKEKTSIDFYTYHLYPSGSTSPEMDYGTAVDVLTRYGRMGKPAFLGESAGDEFSRGAEREMRRWTMRDIIWFSLANANPGCLFWNARGSEVAEFKVANQVASSIDWGTFRRKRPAIAVEVPHPLDNDKWFRSPEGIAAYTMMGRYARHYLDRGADFDFALDGGGYPLRAGVDRFAPPEPPAADFGISAGYQLKPLVRADGGEALLYVRNFAGVSPWETPKPRVIRQYLRTRKPAPVRIAVHLPGRFRAAIWDLDAATREERTVSGGDTLDLGQSDHDFAIHLSRQ